MLYVHCKENAGQSLSLNASTEPKNFPWLGWEAKKYQGGPKKYQGGPPSHARGGLCRYFGAFLHGGTLHIAPSLLLGVPPPMEVLEAQCICIRMATMMVEI
jgi:hypothetical protein